MLASKHSSSVLVDVHLPLTLFGTTSVVWKDRRHMERQDMLGPSCILLSLSAVWPSAFPTVQSCSSSSDPAHPVARLQSRDPSGVPSAFDVSSSTILQPRYMHQARMGLVNNQTLALMWDPTLRATVVGWSLVSCTVQILRHQVTPLNTSQNRQHNTMHMHALHVHLWYNCHSQFNF